MGYDIGIKTPQQHFHDILMTSLIESTFLPNHMSVSTTQNIYVIKNRRVFKEGYKNFKITEK